MDKCGNFHFCRGIKYRSADISACAYYDIRLKVPYNLFRLSNSRRDFHKCLYSPHTQLSFKAVHLYLFQFITAVRYQTDLKSLFCSHKLYICIPILFANIVSYGKCRVYVSCRAPSCKQYFQDNTPYIGSLDCRETFNTIPISVIVMDRAVLP